MNDDILCYCFVLCSPFGPRASILSQCSYMHVTINFVPVLYNDEGNHALSEELWCQLEINDTFKNLCIVSAPRWLHSPFKAPKAKSLVILSFLDEDGSHLPHITKNPVFMFGAACKAKLFDSLPLIRQCD